MWIRADRSALHGAGTRQPQCAAVVVGLCAGRQRSAAAPNGAEIVKTGPLVGQREDGIDAYSGSHPNAVVAGPEAIYVANGNNDSISVLDPRTYEERDRIGLSLLRGQDRSVEGRAAGRPRVQSGRRLSVRGGGGRERPGRDQARRQARRSRRPHSDRLVAEQRAGQRRWSIVVCRQRPRPRRRAQPGRREPLAEVQRARDGEHHSDAIGSAVGCVHRARLCQQRASSTSARDDDRGFGFGHRQDSRQSDPERDLGRRAPKSSTSSSSTRRTPRTTCCSATSPRRGAACR